MAIDRNNPLLNGPKRVDSIAGPTKDYKALYERAIKRQEVLEEQVRTLQAQLDGKVPAGFGRGAKPGLSGNARPAAPQRPATQKTRHHLPAQSKPIAPVRGQTDCPEPGSPEFDSTKHGLLAPPKITHRKLS
ncbi:MAG: hypothetical protein EOO61_17395 [Hymenobacter sp.]|nr:MAG: hypothetical protein EOO61_17395 [Hymenobacter sp.]